MYRDGEIAPPIVRPDRIDIVRVWRELSMLRSTMIAIIGVQLTQSVLELFMGLIHGNHSDYRERRIDYRNPR